MPPKGKKGKKGKKKGKDTPAPEEKPKTPEPTEKEILLQEEYVYINTVLIFCCCYR